LTPPCAVNFFVSVSGGVASLGGSFLVNPERLFSFAGMSMSVQQPLEFTSGGHSGPSRSSLFQNQQRMGC